MLLIRRSLSSTSNGDAAYGAARRAGDVRRGRGDREVRGTHIRQASRLALRERITSGTFNELFQVPAQTLQQASV